MNVQPLRDFVVVSKDEQVKQTASGLHIVSSNDNRIISGTILAVGSGKISNGILIPLEVHVGDKVMFSKNLVIEIKENDKDVFLIKEENLLCIAK